MIGQFDNPAMSFGGTKRDTDWNPGMDLIEQRLRNQVIEGFMSGYGECYPSDTGLHESPSITVAAEFPGQIGALIVTCNRFLRQGAGFP